jgi:catechol-2,3-dioxygenase
MSDSQALSQEALQLSHMGFAVHDIRLMATYYQEVLDFKVTDQGQLGTTELMFLSRNEKEHHQIVMATGRPQELPFNPINQISFRVPNIAFLKLFLSRAKANPGTHDLVSICHGNALSIYFRDPEGNRIEIFFDTPWYCEQPLREMIDFELSEEEIMQMAYKSASSRPGFCSREEWLAKMHTKMNPQKELQ